MPLKKGSSKATVQANIKKEISMGKNPVKPLPLLIQKLESLSLDVARKSKH